MCGVGSPGSAQNLVSHRTSAAQRSLWDDEWRRCFGNARFDEVIDFSGYGPFFSTLLLHAPDAERSIWLHNDMISDAHRVTQGRRRHLRDLRGIFSLYRDFDHLVSVSASLNEINRASLASWANPSRFTSARNLANVETVLENAAVAVRTAVVDPETGETPAWAARLVRGSAQKTFVTVGRLSAEKNHARLLDAFAEGPSLASGYATGDRRIGAASRRPRTSRARSGRLGRRDLRGPPGQPARHHGRERLLRALERLRGAADGAARGADGGASRS